MECSLNLTFQVNSKILLGLVNPGPPENSVVWQNTAKCKEGKLVASYVFTM
jgi:hypothetical protein